jgi:hypothetical protein
MESGNRIAILDALKFSMMEVRYHQVPEAAVKTFTWIFDDCDSQKSSNPYLKYPFKTWLTSGDGIFHICGKPGSGKSTLMKYIFQHSETVPYLQTWAGEKELIVAPFFFWKPGGILQKSLVGMVRFLLYYVLQRCPEAIADLFLQHWNPPEHTPWGPRKTIALSEKEILDAFENFIMSGDICSEYRFCFFIDGLDEFEEGFLKYRDLVVKLKHWVELSRGGVKLCVSSREVPVFLGRLELSQRIRLQDLTKRDIEVFVHGRLEKEERFEDMRKFHGDKCERFEEHIVAKADGVFLWVTLAMTMISEGLEVHESLAELEEKLNLLPQELEAFFQHILDSIPKAQQRKAYRTLSYTMTAARSNDIENFVCGEYLFSPLSLLRFSFLDEYIDEPRFVKSLEFRDMTKPQIETRLIAAAAQVTGRCKGLLELRSSNNWRARAHSSGSTIEIPNCAIMVDFTHRSIPEYLAEFIKESGPKYLGGFDPKDALLQTLIAVLKTIPPDPEVWSGYYDPWMPLLTFQILEIRDSPVEDRTVYFDSLDDLDAVCYRRQLSRFPDYETHKWTKYFLLDGHATKPCFKVILCIANLFSFHEFVAWKLRKSPLTAPASFEELWLWISAVIPALGRSVHRYALEATSLDRYITSLSQLRQLSIDFNRNFDSGTQDFYELSNIWSCLVECACMGSPGRTNEHAWAALEVLLEFNVDIPSWEYTPTQSKGDLDGESGGESNEELGEKPDGESDGEPDKKSVGESEEPEQELENEAKKSEESEAGRNERLEVERLKREKTEAEQLEREKVEAERLERKKIMQEKLKGEVRMIIGEKAHVVSIYDISLDTRFVRMLQETDGLILMENLVEFWNPHNAAAILQLLEKRAKPSTKFDELKPVVAEAEKGDEIQENAVGVHKSAALRQSGGNSSLSWQRLFRVEAIPWLLVGKLVCLEMNFRSQVL